MIFALFNYAELIDIFARVVVAILAVAGFILGMKNWRLQHKKAEQEEPNIAIQESFPPDFWVWKVSQDRKRAVIGFRLLVINRSTRPNSIISHFLTMEQDGTHCGVVLGNYGKSGPLPNTVYALQLPRFRFHLPAGSTQSCDFRLDIPIIKQDISKFEILIFFVDGFNRSWAYQYTPNVRWPKKEGDELIRPSEA